MYKKIILSLLLFTSFVSANTVYKSIKFENLTQISQKVALEVSGFKENTQFTDKQLNKAIKKFYDFNYFQDIKVISQDNGLIFYFVEKPFIVSLEMEGYKTREDDLEVLYDSINIRKGNMYSEKKLAIVKKNLLKELEREGYINSVVEIEVEKINDSSVAIKFFVNKGEEIIITKVNYYGAKELTKIDFEDSTSNKEVENFSWWFGQNDGEMSFEQLEYDGLRIKEVYLEHGFLDVTVSEPFSKIDFNTNTAQIEINIDEGSQYKVNNIVIYLDEDIKNPDKIYPELKSKKNKIFNIKKLRQDVNYIKIQVANKGYAFAQVNYDIRKDIKNETVDLVYSVVPGDKVYINDVIISGNNRTLDRVIRRNIYLAPEDLFSLTDFKDSINALKRTGFFDVVNIKKQRISKTKLNLLVTVTEAPTGNLIFGGGYGSYDGWMINASVNDKNIFGSGLNLGFSIDHSNKKDTASLSLSNPAINDSIYNGSISLYKKESTITNNDINTTLGDKKTSTTGASAGFGRSIGRHTRIGATYSIEKEDTRYELSNTSNQTYTTNSITPYISFNNTDDYYIPRDGIITGSSLKMAGLGGDAKYMLSSTYFKYFYSLEDMTDMDLILRYKTSLKVLRDTGEIPEGTSFYLGGPSSLRGYSSYAFQPNDSTHPFKKYFTNTAELSFPLFPSAKMRWALFYDYGMIGEDSFTAIKKSGRGVVVSWYSPVGPLQFIFSRAIDPAPNDNTSNFEFSLGSKF